MIFFSRTIPCEYTRRLAIFLACFCLVFFVSVQFVFGDKFDDPLKYKSVQELLEAVVETVIFIMTPVIVLMVVYTGFLFVMAQGNPGKLETARTSLMWTLLGAIIVLGAFGISKAIKSTVDSVLVMQRGSDSNNSLHVS